MCDKIIFILPNCQAMYDKCHIKFFSKAKVNLIGFGDVGDCFNRLYGMIVDLGAWKGPEVVLGAPVG